jgi:hypothetical protein
VLTYYLLILKKKYSGIDSKNYEKYPYLLLKPQFKTRKLEASQRFESQMTGEKVKLSSIYGKAKRGQLERKVTEEEMI